MSWIYKHQTAALAVFTGAAFVMCLGALIHTATWGYPVPKAAYLASTIIYVIAAPVYLFFWYHSRLYAAPANPINYLHRRRPWTSRPAEDPERVSGPKLRDGPTADTQAPPKTPPRVTGQRARPPATASYPYMPQPVDYVAAHPPAARFSTLAPPVSRVPPPSGPRMPPGAITRRPISSVGIPAGAPPADPTRLGGVKEPAVPPAAEKPLLEAPAKTRPSISSLSLPAGPSKPVQIKAEYAVPVQAGNRGRTPVERHGARPVIHGPCKL